MNYIDFIQEGGFPLSCDVLDVMQTNYETLQEIAEGFGFTDNLGDAIVLRGCVDNGTSTTSGLIFVNTGSGKEILPFEGGTNKDYYLITGTTEQREFYNGECKDIFYNRRCVLTDTTTYFPTANLQRPKKNTELQTNINSINTTLSGLTEYSYYNSVPIGTIVMWTDYNALPIPDGWALCDGGTTNPNSFQRPDLRGMFVVGYNPDNSSYDALGHGTNTDTATGEDLVTLQSNQIPEHEHVFLNNYDKENIPYYRYGTTSYVVQGDSNNSSAYEYKTRTVDNRGESHENRPPYYVVKYIIKIYH